MEKLIYDKTYLRYLLSEERDCFLTTYIEQLFPPESWEAQKYVMFEHPFFANKYSKHHTCLNL